MLTENAKATGKLLNLVAYRKQVKGDALLERTVADLMAKGTDELRAHIIAINTLRD